MSGTGTLLRFTFPISHAAVAEVFGHGDNALEGCILDVVPERRITFTDALVAGYRPAGAAMFGFTAIITMEHAPIMSMAMLMTTPHA